MKYIFSFILFLLILQSSIVAQDATNVRVHQEGENIIITYDLTKLSDVRVFVAMGQSAQYTELKAVIGDIGKNISTGTNKKIVWQPLKEQTEFVSQNVRFKIETGKQYFFSVGPNKKVVFSKGNLQYRPSTKTWRFAEHQYDYVGKDNVNISTRKYNGWIDLFCWGTGKKPTETRTANKSHSFFSDWGINCIGNDTANTWRTPTAQEWAYLFRDRTDADKLFGFGTINRVCGLIILPDNWSSYDNTTTFTPSVENGMALVSGCLYDTRNGVSDYNDNVYTISQWEKLEMNGAVFLPAAGSYMYNNFNAIGKYGRYWSSTYTPIPKEAYTMGFSVTNHKAGLSVSNGMWYNYRYSVRLVKGL